MPTSPSNSLLDFLAGYMTIAEAKRLKQLGDQLDMLSQPGHANKLELDAARKEIADIGATIWQRIMISAGRHGVYLQQQRGGERTET